MVAPSPFSPAWGGPSQLFTNQNRPDAVDNPSSAIAEDVEAVDDQGTESRGRETSGTSSNGAATSNLLVSEAESDQPEGFKGTLEKGKAKAATVEAVYDDE